MDVEPLCGSAAGNPLHTRMLAIAPFSNGETSRDMFAIGSSVRYEEEAAFRIRTYIVSLG